MRGSVIFLVRALFIVHYYSVIVLQVTDTPGLLKRSDGKVHPIY